MYKAFASMWLRKKGPLILCYKMIPVENLPSRLDPKYHAPVVEGRQSNAFIQ